MSSKVNFGLRCTEKHWYFGLTQTGSLRAKPLTGVDLFLNGKRNFRIVLKGSPQAGYCGNVNAYNFSVTSENAEPLLCCGQDKDTKKKRIEKVQMSKQHKSWETGARSPCVARRDGMEDHVRGIDSRDKDWEIWILDLVTLRLPKFQCESLQLHNSYANCEMYIQWVWLISLQDAFYLWNLCNKVLIKSMKDVCKIITKPLTNVCVWHWREMNWK